MERMAERIPGSNDQALQHFLSCSPWSERPVVDQVAQDANSLFKNHPDTGLYIDETGFVKKGTKSVGVHRQWIAKGKLIVDVLHKQVWLWDGKENKPHQLFPPA